MQTMTTAPELAGRHVRLVALGLEHVPGLIEAARDGALWELGFTSIPNPEGMAAYVAHARAEQAQGRALAYAVLDAEGAVVGSTRCCHIDWATPRLEIGYTWYAQRVQRSALNTEAKFLLLEQAFERFGCVAVEFRTHHLNLRSRAAILRLGAQQDGILRQHQRLADGSLRDTVVFSILEPEWPEARAHLTRLLVRRSAQEL
jgi:RimJ/RimL family protein N-acetyltransferase